MNNPKYIFQVEFTYVPPQDRKSCSKTGTLNASTDFRYHGGFKNKGDITLVKNALALIRQTGIHEKIIKSDSSFPSKLRIVYSLARIKDFGLPQIDISPLEEEILYSALGNINSSSKNYPQQSIFEARADAIDLEYDFVYLTLRFNPAEEHILLENNGCIIKESEQWRH